jgi:hypothetical protein
MDIAHPLERLPDFGCCVNAAPRLISVETGTPIIWKFECGV